MADKDSGHIPTWNGEAISRLHEDKLGIKPEEKDFGLPDDAEEWDEWDEWWPDAEEPPPDDEEDSKEDQDPKLKPSASTTSAAAGPQDMGGSPSHHGSAGTPAVEKTSPAQAKPLDELSLADSFVLGVLRGFRLLQAAGLNPDEKRDIISTTKGSLEFETVTQALQTLWDDQLLGGRNGSFGQQAMFQELCASQAADDWWEDEDSWNWHAYVGTDDWSSWDYDLDENYGFHAYEESWDEEPNVLKLLFGKIAALVMSPALIDSGATASAGPEESVKVLIQALLSFDPGASIDVQPYVTEATPKKAPPAPFDSSRAVYADPRDPRCQIHQWPCYNQHQAGKPLSNPHGQWVDCQVCHLRLKYVPREGKHGNTTRNDSPAMVQKMLNQLEPLMRGYKPTIDICRAMFKKIEAEESLMVTINQAILRPEDKHQVLENDHGYGLPAGACRTVSKHMAAKVMLMAATLTTALTNTAMDLIQDQRDGLWEFACAPDSWLTKASERQGLHCKRVNLHQGYDLYQPATWERLAHERKVKRPKRLWFSLPCTKWCPWTRLNYQGPERQELLESYRRRERRMLGYAARFIKDALEEDPETFIYWEWPKECLGWHQRALQDLQAYMEEQCIPWQQCRIDGCCYDLKSIDGTGFIHKKWRINTTDEGFWSRFKAKTCPALQQVLTLDFLDLQRLDLAQEMISILLDLEMMRCRSTNMNPPSQTLLKNRHPKELVVKKMIYYISHGWKSCKSMQLLKSKPSA
ncbi:Integrase catalytic domain-containing protein [Durusdinium trenchii]|uniref:Integrase catalytic domain-containing protein n=1 Tax=Durusdinium trenchii TaxID=1381693 RepID=A0ABP0SR52_9DINO